MKIEQSKIEYFQINLLEWFKENGRNFPWREEGRTSYELVIAEVLLQRTRAETVSKKFNSFLNKFSTWQEINNTTREELEKALKPFGLYRQKGERLKNLAEEMIKRNGKLPMAREELENIPLLGQYITSAIISYVHGQSAPLLDVNMARVLERFFGPRKLADIRYDPYLQKLSKRIVDHAEHQKINWAVLDFASLICKKKPLCEKCVLRKECKYYEKFDN
jgi:A/G-specific adenine glycosylase